MANEQLARLVEDFQAEFLRRLGQSETNLLAPPMPLLLRKIYDSNHDLLRYAFGDLGVNLGRYTQSLDLNHPDVISVLDGLFQDGQRFSQACLELLGLAEYARHQGMSHVFPDMGSLLVREMLSKAVVKRLDTTSLNRLQVRLIKDPAERDGMRLTKKMQVIDLEGVFRKGEEAWASQPDSFKKFLRFDSAYDEELEAARKKMRRYEELGCHALAKEIAKSIEAFSQNVEQSYYGFNRITMTNAAVVLAKSLGFSFFCQPLYTSTPAIRMSESYFEDFNFDASGLVGPKRTYIYNPKVYPFHQLRDIAPDSVLQTVGKLESFPEANYKPIFDHYGVIVPSFIYNFDSFYDKSGLLLKYDTIESCNRDLDRALIKTKSIYPIVVGEKDGKAYFVCYWA